MAQGSTKAPQDILSELGVDDLYNFIGVEFQATDKEVRLFSGMILPCIGENLIIINSVST